MGADTITTANNGATAAGTVAGTDVIVGDNGFVQMDVVGGLFAQIGSKSQPSTASTTYPLSVTDLGGVDTINAGTGTKVVLGGDAGDTIKLGLGTTNDHIVIGDNGVITYVPITQTGAGQAWIYETTDTLVGTGGDDTIQTGSGNNVILGGMGVDLITTVNGSDLILGDSGIVERDVEGNNLKRIASKAQASAGGGTTDLGRGDTIASGTGAKTVLGGDGADGITLGTGNHTVVGDNGVITYVAMDATGEGRALRYESTDTLASTGGNDTITAGDGDNVVLGGMGADTITTANNGATAAGTVAGTDVIVGDNGFVQMDVVGGLFAQIGSKSQPSTASTTYPGSVTDLGGLDTINAGTGTKVVLG